ncbi:MAG: hypothetical protein QM658_12215 [Gordonia sp. (in: high G+C Gram-positive bacteria)]
MRQDTAAMLRARPSLTGTPQPESTGPWADSPEGQFLAWLSSALESGVAEPHVGVRPAREAGDPADWQLSANRVGEPIDLPR